MEIIKISNLSFTYPEEKTPALDRLDLSVQAGEFVCLFGPSGCGKSTLLSLIKKARAPYGEKTGEIVYAGTGTDGLDERKAASCIGFVGQDPDAQIVADTVWHELAFGPESLGYDTPFIRRRVSEMAVYFGIESWFRRPVSSLSGGQKQLLNLASVMVMDPDVLLLDEPTAQLDPVAAANFIGTLRKLNRELGLTVILAEHRLEDIFPVSDTAVLMKEGRIEIAARPSEAVRYLLHAEDHPMRAALPAAARIFGELQDAASGNGGGPWDAASPVGGGPDKLPLTVQEGRAVLFEMFGVPGNGPESGEACLAGPAPGKRKAGQKENMKDRRCEDAVPALSLTDIWFRYERTAPDVLKGLSLTVDAGTHYCILGGNGAGKSTLLRVIAGAERPYRGQTVLFGEKMKGGKTDVRKTACLPQDPHLLFLMNTVREDLLETCRMTKENRDTPEDRIRSAAALFELEGILERHPYDLSGGELQRAAFAKILLTEPELILLDEPTKGIDPGAKKKLAGILSMLKARGVTVVTVTHDVEFAAQCADRAGLLFDGCIVSEDAPGRFFSDNLFFTTAASRITRGFLKETVTSEDAIAALRRTDTAQDAK